MRPNERDALIKYLEYRLLGLVDCVKNDVDPLVNNRLIQEAHDILTDIEDSLIIQQVMNLGSSISNR